LKQKNKQNKNKNKNKQNKNKNKQKQKQKTRRGERTLGRILVPHSLGLGQVLNRKA
jgi:DNA replication protein DnaD